jgi:hypothetical protein
MKSLVGASRGFDSPRLQTSPRRLKLREATSGRPNSAPLLIQHSVIASKNRDIVRSDMATRRKRDRWELVAFISTESGHDLIVSFAVYEPEDPAAVESLTVLRIPEHEGFLYEWERGAAVSFDREPVGDERVLLREVVYAPDDRTVVLRTDHHTYKLDVGKIDPKELSAMCRVFRKMNFDSSIQLTGL